MQPSSLVFVAIVVGWAAYLLPQWVRRRDTLSQSRGHDRHSAGLRVLDRRTRVVAGPSSVPLLPDPGTTRAGSVPPAGIADRKVDTAARRPGDASLRQPPSRQAPSGAAVSSGVSSAGSSAASAAARLAARRRARVLTLLLAVTGVAWVASVWVSAVTSVAVVVSTLLALDVVALLVSARRRAVRRAVADRVRRRELERRTASRAHRAPARPAVPAATVEPSSAPADGAAETSEPAVEAPAERVARELAEGGTPWIPVPVPPPTYTLKPAAPRPEPAPLDLPPTPRPTDPATSGDAAAEPAARTPRPWDDDRTFADDLDLDAVLARRRAVNG